MSVPLFILSFLFRPSPTRQPSEFLDDLPIHFTNPTSNKQMPLDYHKFVLQWPLAVCHLENTQQFLPSMTNLSIHGVGPPNYAVGRDSIQLDEQILPQIFLMIVIFYLRSFLVSKQIKKSESC